MRTLLASEANSAAVIGVDLRLATTREIYQLMLKWTALRIAIILIGSEMAELLMLSGRIAVMRRESISAELARA
jgi:ABC-type sugar transport system ATPase subunit